VKAYYSYVEIKPKKKNTRFFISWYNKYFEILKIHKRDVFFYEHFSSDFDKMSQYYDSFSYTFVVQKYV